MYTLQCMVTAFSRRLLLVSLALYLGACTPTPASLFAEGQRAFQKHDYRTARLQLEAGLKQQPENRDMQLLIIRTLLKLGDGEQANVRLQSLAPELQSEEHVKLLQAEADILRGRFASALTVLANINSATVDRLRALAYIGNGEIPRAVESFDVGLKRETTSALLLATYARFEFERGNWKRADELSVRALKHDPKLIDAMLVQADLLERRNQLPESLEAFQKVLGLHAANFEALLGKARVLAAMGMGREALAIAADLQAAEPKSATVAAVRAEVAAQAGDWETVRSTLQGFEKDLTSVPQAAVLYAQALVELGLPGQALVYLAPQFERQPGWRAVRVLYARALTESGEAVRALAVLRPLVDRSDANPHEIRLAAKIAEKANDPAASRLAHRIDKISPEWVGGQIAQADQAMRNRQWGQAEDAYLAIVARLGPNNAMVLNNLAFVQGKLGKDKDAMKNAMAAVELEPANASILDTAGVLLVANGKRESGIAMLRKANRIEPDNPTIKRHLAEAEAS